MKFERLFDRQQVGARVHRTHIGGTLISIDVAVFAFDAPCRQRRESGSPGRDPCRLR
jgi:hypothetical protein